METPKEEDPNLQEIHDFLIEIAHRAGEVILAARPTTEASGTKKNSTDIVTETDKAVEKAVFESIHAKYPSFDFIGEETYRPGQALSPAPTFIVDPIDGTTNFLHAFPIVCISLGFVHHRVPQVGVVYNPFTSTLFTAIRGHGAFASTLSSRAAAAAPATQTAPPFTISNQRRLPLRDPEPLTLRTALIAVEWGSDRAGNDMAVKARAFARLARSTDEGGAMVHALRSVGTAALNLCAVAAGQLDAFWEAGCWAWDVAAGWCILNEAGGFMAGANPGEWTATLEGRRFFAVRAAPEGEGEQRRFVEELWGFVEGRFEVGG